MGGHRPFGRWFPTCGGWCRCKQQGDEETEKGDENGNWL